MSVKRQPETTRFGTVKSNFLGTGIESQAPSGYGAYDSLFRNNPYRNLQYNKSAWQTFLGNLGFRTDYDRWAEEAQYNAAQWDAGVYQQMFQDQYNSEAAKAERMRAAGENPDLLGTGNVAEASSPLEDPEGLTSGSGEEGVIGQLASGVMSAFNSAIGIATQFMQFQGIANDVESKGISNADAMMRTIQFRVLGMTPAEGFKTDQEFKDWRRSTEMKLRGNYGRAFFKGSSLRRWNRSIDDFVGGLPTSRDQYAAWRQRLGDAKDYLMGREDHWSEIIDAFKVVAGPLIDLRRELTENKAVLENTTVDAQIEEQTNKLTYEQEVDPGMKAAAENQRNTSAAAGEDFNGILNRHLKKLGERLDNLSRQGGLKGLIGEVILLLMTMRGTIGVNSKGAELSLTPPTQK